VVLVSDAPAGLLPARQQMAVSLGFHIVLAFFGLPFPAMIYVMNRRGIVRGEPIGLQLAKRHQQISALRNDGSGSRDVEEG
jgi:cytochrome bd ubiquinol oxidase subunit I